MSIFSIDFVLFTLGGYSVSLLELLSVLLGFTNVFLAGRGNKNNYWFGYVYALLLFFLFWQKHLYASMILQPISLGITIYGHWSWTHPKSGTENNKKELRVSRILPSNIMWGALAIAVGTLVWGWCNQRLNVVWPETFPPATKPFLDAAVVCTMFFAQLLSARKKLECWYVWMVVNTTNIILYVMAGMAFLPLVSFSYLILAILGFINWKKEWRKDNNE